MEKKTEKECFTYYLTTWKEARKVEEGKQRKEISGFRENRQEKESNKKMLRSLPEEEDEEDEQVAESRGRVSKFATIIV